MEHEQSVKAISILADTYAVGMEKALKEATKMLLVDGNQTEAAHIIESAYMAIVVETLQLSLASPIFWKEVIDSMEGMESLPKDNDQVMARLEEEIRNV